MCRSGSGLDADLLDGKHASEFAASTTRTFIINGQNYNVYSPYTTNANLDNVYLKKTGGTISVSNIDGLIISRNGTGYPMICYYNDEIYGYLGFNAKNSPVFRETSGAVYHALIHDGNISSYNAGSATKLQTSRTIWGQSFDGTANVSGDMNGVGHFFLLALMSDIASEKGRVRPAEISSRPSLTRPYSSNLPTRAS